MSTHANMVKMTVSSVSATPSTGKGDITLNAASTGFQSFADAYGGNATVDILITKGAEWEVARNCTYTHSGTTLTRGTWEDSSNGTGAIVADNTAVVSVVATAGFGNLLDQQLNRGLTAVVSSASTTQTMTGEATTKITTALSTVTYNPYTWWDTTNTKFLPTRAGNYLIFYGTQRANGSGIITQCSVVNSNGAQLVGAVSTVADAKDVVSGIMYFNGSTDYAECFLYHSATLTTANNANGASFQVIYLG